MRITKSPSKRRRGVLARTRSFVLRLQRRREKPLSETGVAIFLAIYALGFYAVGFHDPGYLLLSWLMTGPLAVTVYLTFDGRGSLMNPYTLFFAAIVLGSFAAYVLAGKRTLNLACLEYENANYRSSTVK